MLIIQTLIIFTVLIGVLIFVHELGHFFAAKIIGVKVEEFALGFGNKIWAKKIGETDYRINFIPFGGYVKLLGEEGAVNDPRSFSAKRISQRAFVLFAGVVMNFILGIIIFYIFLANSSFHVPIVHLVDYNFIGVNQENIEAEVLIVRRVADSSPLASHNIESGSIITRIDGELINSSDQFQQILQAKANTTVSVELLNLDNKFETFTITLNPRGGDQGIIGIEYNLFDIYNLDYTGENRYLSGISHALNMLGYQLFALGDLVRQSFADRTVEPIATNVTGVVGLAEQTYQLTKFGELKDILNLAGLVSIMLAFMNILPIPMLDGGHVAFLFLEKLRGRRVAEKYEEWANKAGFIFLIGLTILITIKDFIQFDILQRLFGVISNIFS